MEGVTTTCAFISQVGAAVWDQTRRVAIGESNGGYQSYTYRKEEAFDRRGLYRLQDGFGTRVTSLSVRPVEPRIVEVGGSPVTVELPSFLLYKVDIFISLPVREVHVMTQVSLGFKNQWGCQPGAMRLRNHAASAEKIPAINILTDLIRKW